MDAFRHSQTIPDESGTTVFGGIPEVILGETYEEIL